MSSSRNIVALPSAEPRQAETYSAADAEIADAIARAQQNLLRQQHEDGHWCGELLVDSTLCSDFVLFMHWLGEVDDTLQQRCVRHILKRQLPDGGWNIYYGGASGRKPGGQKFFPPETARAPAALPLTQ